MNSDDGLIPMINIVFLLLVFFMVAGAVKPVEPLDIEPPESAQTGDQSAAHVVHVAVDNSLALDGHVLSEAELGRAVSLIMAKHELIAREQKGSENASDGITSSLNSGDTKATEIQKELGEQSPVLQSENPARPALAIRADGQITFKRLREVFNVLRDAGVSDVELLTAWVPSEAD